MEKFNSGIAHLVRVAAVLVYCTQPAQAQEDLVLDPATGQVLAKRVADLEDRVKKLEEKQQSAVRSVTEAPSRRHAEYRVKSLCPYQGRPNWAALDVDRWYEGRWNDYTSVLATGRTKFRVEGKDTDFAGLLAWYNSVQGEVQMWGKEAPRTYGEFDLMEFTSTSYQQPRAAPAAQMYYHQPLQYAAPAVQHVPFIQQPVQGLDHTGTLTPAFTVGTPQVISQPITGATHVGSSNPIQYRSQEVEQVQPAASGFYRISQSGGSSTDCGTSG